MKKLIAVIFILHALLPAQPHDAGPNGLMLEPLQEGEYWYEVEVQTFAEEPAGMPIDYYAVGEDGSVAICHSASVSSSNVAIKILLYSDSGEFLCGYYFTIIKGRACVIYDGEIITAVINDDVALSFNKNCQILGVGRVLLCEQNREIIKQIKSNKKMINGQTYTLSAGEADPDALDPVYCRLQRTDKTGAQFCIYDSFEEVTEHRHGAVLDKLGIPLAFVLICGWIILGIAKYRRKTKAEKKHDL